MGDLVSGVSDVVSSIGSGVSDAASSVFGSGAPAISGSDTSGFTASLPSGAVDTTALAAPGATDLAGSGGGGPFAGAPTGDVSSVAPLSGGGGGFAGAPSGPTVSAGAPMNLGGTNTIGGTTPNAGGGLLQQLLNAPDTTTGGATIQQIDPGSYAATTNPNVGGGTGGGGSAGINTPFGTIPFGDILKGALTGGVLGYEALNQPSVPSQASPAAVTTSQSNLAQQQQQNATNLQNTGTTLLNPLVTGQLPAGAQSAISQASDAAVAQIQSQYANLGLSGSTMEAQAIQQARATAVQQGFQLAQQMAQTGLGVLGQAGGDTALASQLYQQIYGDQLQEDQQLQNALTNFASSLAGGNIARTAANVA